MTKILLGAIVTVITTIVGGVILWLVTDVIYEKNRDVGFELQYSFEQLNQFELLDVSYTTYGLNVMNKGKSVQEDVSILVSYSNLMQLVDLSIIVGSSPFGEIEPAFNDIVENDPAKQLTHFRYNLERLRPSETVSVTLIFSGQLNIFPQTNINSLSAVAVEREIGSPNVEQLGFFYTPLAKILLVGAYVLFVFPISVGTLRYFLLRNSAGFSIYNYNTSFALLHRGLVEDSISILHEIASKKGLDANAFSTLGLAYAAQGEDEKSTQCLYIADWFSGTRRAKANILFNRSCVETINKNFDEAKVLLRNALEMHKSIKIYCQHSIYVEELTRNDTMLLELIGHHKNNSKTKTPPPAAP